MVLVLLGRGLRNRKTIARAICLAPMRMDGAPQLARDASSSVQMTIPGCARENRQMQRRRVCGWVMIYIPPIAKCAMDGAPGRLGWSGEGTGAWNINPAPQNGDIR